MLFLDGDDGGVRSPADRGGRRSECVGRPAQRGGKFGVCGVRVDGVGACEGCRCSLLGDRGTGDRKPSFMRKGDGGVSPRSRRENRRKMDFFLDNNCGDSVAMIVCYPTMRSFLVLSP